ncbi:MAG: 4-hydroxy-tetrahydrodipicolinate synthase [Tidjanibacter sp.]|nr:4-hydroxy-tetrahydrodipicolinate synthase [Tidjanibacter sp.]MBR3932069.1 4-hydroxy-tetrahydrodipicolinate synthase [Tidjanibacter sp.]
MKTKLTGLGVALVTPFTPSGEVDFEALRRLVDMMIEGGADYLVVMGTTGETPTLTLPERVAVLRTVKERNAGRLPIVVGVGGNDTARVVELINQTNLDGVDAILSVTPFYNKPAQRGLFEHYKYIAERSPRPIILYNVPGRTGVNMEAETTLRIARECPNVVAIKEASGNIEQIKQVIEGAPEGFMVISGDDSLALPVIKAGGVGVISVAANAFPKYFSTMIKAQFEQQWGHTEVMFEKIRPMVKMLFAEGNPPGVKAALAARGVMSNVLRLPLVSVSDELYDKIAESLRENGFE